MSFKRLRVVNMSLIGAGALLEIVALVVSVKTLTLIFGIAGIALMLSAVVFNLCRWRCPKCKGALPLRAYKSMKYCPYCGENLPFLQEEDDEEG